MVNASTSRFLKIHLNIIFPSMSWSPKWSLSLRFPCQNPVYASPLPHSHYIPCPPHSSQFYHPNNIGWVVQIIKFLLCSLLHSPVTLSLLGPNTLLINQVSNTLSLRSSLSVNDQVLHPYKTGDKIILLYILIFIFLDSKQNVVLIQLINFLFAVSLFISSHLQFRRFSVLLSRSVWLSFIITMLTLL
jgi:hypothetical protein